MRGHNNCEYVTWKRLLILRKDGLWIELRKEGEGGKEEEREGERGTGEREGDRERRRERKEGRD